MNNITDDEKVADWLARLRSDLEIFGFPRNRDTYQRALDIAIKRFMEGAYPNSFKKDEKEQKEVSDLVHPLWNLNKNLQDSKERDTRKANEHDQSLVFKLPYYAENAMEIGEILDKYGFNLIFSGHYNQYVMQAPKYKWTGGEKDYGWKGVPIYYVTGDVITDPEYLTQKCDEFKEILDAHIKAGRIVKNEESTDE